MPESAPRPIRCWTVEVTCPCCAGILAHRADGRPTGGTAVALASCTRCGRLWKAELTLTDVGSPRGIDRRDAHPPDCTCSGCHRRSAA